MIYAISQSHRDSKTHNQNECSPLFKPPRISRFKMAKTQRVKDQGQGIHQQTCKQKEYLPGFSFQKLADHK